MFVKFFGFLILVGLIIAVERNSNCTMKQQELICYKHYLPTISIESNLTFYNNFTKILQLYDLDMKMIDLNIIIKQFPNIENISIIGGNLYTFIIPATTNNHIRVLKLKEIGIENIGNSFLNKFPHLETLNLENNYLQYLRKDFNYSHLRNLYLAGNTWNCSLDTDWVLNLNETIVKDLHNLTCYDKPHNGKSLLTIAKFMKDIKSQCTKNCNCTLPKVVINPETEQLEPIIEVNCSDRGLINLPKLLPNNTKILHLESNDIKNLNELKTNLIYHQLQDLYVDNNRINSIEELEGSYWLRHFRVFSLTGNKLTELPTYALDNALQQNINMPNALRINLGGNPWRCDCVFTPVFQQLLQKYASQVQDVHQVKCSYVEGDENSLLPIIELSRSSVCRLPIEYSVQALDLLNVVLASLIVLILGKLAYDYYHFKKTGKLPWIVTKMP